MTQFSCDHMHQYAQESRTLINSYLCSFLGTQPQPSFFKIECPPTISFFWIKAISVKFRWSYFKCHNSFIDIFFYDNDWWSLILELSLWSLSTIIDFSVIVWWPYISFRREPKFTNSTFKHHYFPHDNSEGNIYDVSY